MEAMTTAPTFWQVAKRPQWIGILAACLAVAAIFGILANWQTARAVEGGQGDDRDTETPVALDSVAVPGEPLTSEAGGRIVTVTATVQPDDFIVLNGRQAGGGRGMLGRRPRVRRAGREQRLRISHSPRTSSTTATRARSTPL